MVDGTDSVTNEEAAAPAATPGAATGAAPAPTTAAKVDLPDTAWPTGGYYWTVVPVVLRTHADDPRTGPGAPHSASGIARPSCRRTPASPAA